MNSYGDSHSVTSDMSSIRSFGSKASTSKKRKADETSEILRELLATRPSPSEFGAKQPNDDIQHFLNSMAVTMRRLSPLAIARIKLKIGTIVGEEEIAWAEQNPVQYVYLDSNAPDDNLLLPTTNETSQQGQNNQEKPSEAMDVTHKSTN